MDERFVAVETPPPVKAIEAKDAQRENIELAFVTFGAFPTFKLFKFSHAENILLRSVTEE